MTYDYGRSDTVRTLTRFARSLCQNFATLQAKGHPKWREVQLALPELKAGWSYYPPVQKELASCIARGPVRAGSPPRSPTKPCSQQERVLGLCG